MKIETHYSPNYRKEVIGPLLESVLKGSCKTLVALRGVGLGPITRFLHYHPVVREKYFHNDENYQFLFINIEELLNSDPKTFLKEFLRELKAHLEEKELKEEGFIKKEYLQGMASEDDQEIFYRIKNLLELATDHDLKIIYMLQEFDEIAKSNSPLLNTIFNLHFSFRPNLVFIYGVHSLPNHLRHGPETKFDYIFHNYLIMKPFTFEDFKEHYSVHIKDRGVKMSEEELKAYYKYSGGLASYNRFIENNFDIKNKENLDQRLEELCHSPQLLITTRQLLSDLEPNELKSLKSFSFGQKIGSEEFKALQNYGLINEKDKIFSKILEIHLSEIEAPSRGLVIDNQTKNIYIDDAEISLYLSPTEYKFLKFLYEHKEQVCGREEIIEYAWGGNPEGISDEAVDQLVSRLRNKLQVKSGRNDLISTVRGRGFTLN